MITAVSSAMGYIWIPHYPRHLLWGLPKIAVAPLSKVDFISLPLERGVRGDLSVPYYIAKRCMLKSNLVKGKISGKFN
jgi:hypothetical protein